MDLKGKRPLGMYLWIHGDSYSQTNAGTFKNKKTNKAERIRCAFFIIKYKHN